MLDLNNQVMLDKLTNDNYHYSEDKECLSKVINNDICEAIIFACHDNMNVYLDNKAFVDMAYLTIEDIFKYHKMFTDIKEEYRKYCNEEYVKLEEEFK